MKVLDVFQTQREIASCSERYAVRSCVCAAETGIVITLIKQSCCKNPDRESVQLIQPQVKSEIMTLAFHLL